MGCHLPDPTPARLVGCPCSPDEAARVSPTFKELQFHTRPGPAFLSLSPSLPALCPSQTPCENCLSRPVGLSLEDGVPAPPRGPPLLLCSARHDRPGLLPRPTVAPSPPCLGMPLPELLFPVRSGVVGGWGVRPAFPIVSRRGVGLKAVCVSSGRLEAGQAALGPGSEHACHATVPGAV